MRIGEISVEPVIDGEGRFRPTKTFRSSEEADWEPHRDLLDADGLLGFAMGGFLVRTGDRVALVDAGVGPASLMGITGGRFLDSLAALGVAPEEVTDLVFTHLHADHIGWATHEGRVVFPHAAYRCSAADREHFSTGPEAEHLAPASERFEVWDGDGPLLPGVDVLAAPGHTPGSTVMVLSSGPERALLLGDVVHCPVQLLDDEWEALFDVDPHLARRTRTRLAAELEGGDALLAGAHFAGLHFGRLLPGQGRRRWVT